MLTLLASGIASSITRVINVFPTTACILLGISPLSLLFYSQVFLSILIPLPMIPFIWYTAKKKVMSPFVNRKITTIVALAVAAIIVLLNIALILTSI